MGVISASLAHPCHPHCSSQVKKESVVLKESSPAPSMLPGNFLILHGSQALHWNVSLLGVLCCWMWPSSSSSWSPWSPLGFLPVTPVHVKFTEHCPVISTSKTYILCLPTTSQVPPVWFSLDSEALNFGPIWGHGPSLKHCATFQTPHSTDVIYVWLLSVLVCQVCQFVGRTVMNHVLYDEPVRQDFVLFDEPVILYDEPSVKFVSVEFII